MNGIKKQLERFLKIPLSGKIPLGIGFLGNGLVLIYCMGYFTVARGAYIRDMMGAVLMGAIAFFTLILGLPTALISFKFCSKPVSIVGVLLSLTPFPLAVLLLHGIAYICGFYLEE